MKITYVAVALILLTVSINQKPTRGNSFFDVTKAFAATYISSSSLNLTTAEGLSNFVRYYYYDVNGGTEEYYTDSGTGLLGMVNGFIGAEGLGAVMNELGYEKCSDFPTSGTGEVSHDGIVSHLTFRPGTKVIPAHFGSDAGQTYTKRIAVKMNNTLSFNMEFKCDPGSPVITGYLLLDFGFTVGVSTPFEITFQQNTATKAVYLDFLTNQPEVKIAVRFSTADGQAYKLYQVATGTQGNAFAINGTVDGVSQVNALVSSDTSNSVANAVIHDVSGVTAPAQNWKASECLDLTTNSATTGCTAITDPGTIGNSFTFSINSVSNLTLSTLAAQ